MALLLRPGRLVHDRRRGIRRIAACHQLLTELLEHACAQENDHRRAVRGELCDLLALRYRRAARHTGDDHGLGNTRKGVLHLQRGSRSAECADARAVIIGNALFLEHIHLLPNRAVHARISGVQPHGRLPCRFCLIDHCQHLFECHLCAVVYLTAFFFILQQLRIDQRSRINNHIGFPKQSASAHGNQIRRA